VGAKAAVYKDYRVMPLEYSPIALESIETGAFPNVALYVKQGEKYILYKGREVKLTTKELDRLQKSKVEFVFVKGTDADDVQTYLENNLKNIFANEVISQKTKNAVLCPIMVNYICDIFKNPEQPETFHKCRKLLEQLIFKITERKELLELLSMAVHHKAYLFTHSAQVAILSMFLHQRLFNVEHDEMVDVGVGSILHDIGMIYIASDILDKTDTLSPTEYFRVRHHPRHGYDTLLKMGVTDPLSLTIVLSHHERYNGTGYPNHLFENEIPRSALVTSICDVYCALTTDRPYSQASTPDDALRSMKREARLFHPEILGEFLAFMSDLKF